MEDCAEIRQLHKAEGLSVNEVARMSGVARNTVRAALRSDRPPSHEGPAASTATHTFWDFSMRSPMRRGASAHPGPRHVGTHPWPAFWCDVRHGEDSGFTGECSTHVAYIASQVLNHFRYHTYARPHRHSRERPPPVPLANHLRKWSGRRPVDRRRPRPPRGAVHRG